MPHLLPDLRLRSRQFSSVLICSGRLIGQCAPNVPRLLLCDSDPRINDARVAGQLSGHLRGTPGDAAIYSDDVSDQVEDAANQLEPHDAVTVEDAADQVEPRAAAAIVDVFVYVVVLNLFVEYLPQVLSETFTLTLLTGPSC